MCAWQIRQVILCLKGIYKVQHTGENVFWTFYKVIRLLWPIRRQFCWLFAFFQFLAIFYQFVCISNSPIQRLRNCPRVFRQNSLRNPRIISDPSVDCRPDYPSGARNRGPIQGNFSDFRFRFPIFHTFNFSIVRIFDSLLLISDRGKWTGTQEFI